MSRADIEAELAARLGFTRVLWLGDGLINDHTDGHVDNLARFVGPNRLVVPEATGAADPNAAIYADAAARAEAFGVEVARIPSPGLLTRDGVIEPASYVNFAITSRLVVVPTFGSPHDADGVSAIAALFPDRDTIGLPGEAVLAGGGGFHCASQQMPSA
jgi:agmatine deiminase